MNLAVCVPSIFVVFGLHDIDNSIGFKEKVFHEDRPLLAEYLVDEGQIPQVMGIA
jgi:hypothetical protein